MITFIYQRVIIRKNVCLRRCKKLYEPSELAQVLSEPRLQYRFIKGKGVPQRTFSDGGAGGTDDACVIPTGLLFLRTTNPPWMAAVSKSRNCRWVGAGDG